MHKEEKIEKIKELIKKLDDIFVNEDLHVVLNALSHCFATQIIAQEDPYIALESVIQDLTRRVQAYQEVIKGFSKNSNATPE